MIKKHVTELKSGDIVYNLLKSRIEIILDLEESTRFGKKDYIVNTIVTYHLNDDFRFLEKSKSWISTFNFNFFGVSNFESDNNLDFKVFGYVTDEIETLTAYSQPINYEKY